MAVLAGALQDRRDVFGEGDRRRCRLVRALCAKVGALGATVNIITSAAAARTERTLMPASTSAYLTFAFDCEIFSASKIL